MYWYDKKAVSPFTHYVARTLDPDGEITNRIRETFYFYFIFVWAQQLVIDFVYFIILL